MQLGTRLRAIRNVRGLTLAEVAGAELSVGLLSKLERDLVRPSLETLVYLARRLDVSPGALLVSEQEVTVSRVRGALAAARAALLLGDPAEAVRAARAAFDALGAMSESAADGPTSAAKGTTVLRARLLALAAEAAVAGGDAGHAAAWVRDASALTAAAATDPAAARHCVADRSGAQVETAWVLGALERRRGALADAERTWTSCLGALEDPPDVHPWWQYLRASVLAELGGLAEARADAERARNLVARAASIAAGLAQAGTSAAALLVAWTDHENVPHAESGAPEPPSASPPSAPEPALPHAALTLAVVAASERLGRRLTLEAARLERAVWAPETRALAPDAPASRGLRLA